MAGLRVAQKLKSLHNILPLVIEVSSRSGSCIKSIYQVNGEFAYDVGALKVATHHHKTIDRFRDADIQVVNRQKQPRASLSSTTAWHLTVPVLSCTTIKGQEKQRLQNIFLYLLNKHLSRHVACTGSRPTARRNIISRN